MVVVVGIDFSRELILYEKLFSIFVCELMAVSAESKGEPGVYEGVVSFTCFLE